MKKYVTVVYPLNN